MTRWHALIPVLVISLAPACGDDGSNDGDGDVDETGDGDSSTGDSETSSGDGDGDSSTGDGDGDSTDSTDDTDSTNDTSDTSDTSDTDDADTTTDSTETGNPDTSVYSAEAFPGGLDRVIVTRVNVDEQSCSQMVIVAPMMFDDFDITIDDPWRVELFRAWDQVDCDMMVQPDAYAEGGVGSIEFLGLDAFDLYPCAMSFEIEFDMDTDPNSWIDFVAENVLVEGVNCG